MLHDKAFNVYVKEFSHENSIALDVPDGMLFGHLMRPITIQDRLVLADDYTMTFIQFDLTTGKYISQYCIKKEKTITEILFLLYISDRYFIYRITNI